MKRKRATDLIEQLLARLDAGGAWPLSLVDAVYVFGSYARGALEPHDVDLAVDVHRDERMVQHITRCLFNGRNPYAELRGQLAGRTRGIQFVFEAAEREQLAREGASMLRLWRRGDSLAQALQALHGIAPDPEAGRAPRDDMIAEFDGLDRVIPRQVRGDLIGWRDVGRITIARLTLPEQPAEPNDPEVANAIEMRWKTDSPLRRAGLAALQYLKHRKVALDDVELAGELLPTPTRLAGAGGEPKWWVDWKWQHYQAIPHCLVDGAGWLEIPAPTRTRPLHALLLTPGSAPSAVPPTRW